MKSIAILGSTGSVGVTTLDVVDRFRDRFRVVAMAAGSNLDLLVDQVERHHPELVSVATAELARELKRRLGPSCKIEIHHGREGAIAVATHPAAAIVVSALVGALGLVRRSPLLLPARISRSPTRKCWSSRARVMTARGARARRAPAAGR